MPGSPRPQKNTRSLCLGYLGKVTQPLNAPKVRSFAFGDKMISKRDANKMQTRGRQRILSRSQLSAEGAPPGPAKPSARPARRSETQHSSASPLGSGNKRTRLLGGNEDRQQPPDPRTTGTTARSPGPGGAGPARPGPEQQRDVRFRPAPPGSAGSPSQSPSGSGDGRGGAGRGGPSGRK